LGPKICLSGELFAKFSIQPLKRSKTTGDGYTGIIWRGPKKAPPIVSFLTFFEISGVIKVQLLLKMKLSAQLLVKFSIQPLKRSRLAPEGARGII